MESPVPVVSSDHPLCQAQKEGMNKLKIELTEIEKRYPEFVTNKSPSWTETQALERSAGSPPCFAKKKKPKKERKPESSPKNSSLISIYSNEDEALDSNPFESNQKRSTEDLSEIPPPKLDRSKPRFKRHRTKRLAAQNDRGKSPESKSQATKRNSSKQTESKRHSSEPPTQFPLVYAPVDYSRMTELDKFYDYLDKRGFISLFSEILEQLYLDETRPEDMMYQVFKVFRDKCKVIHELKKVWRKVVKLTRTLAILQQQYEIMKQHILAVEGPKVRALLRAHPELLRMLSLMENNELEWTPPLTTHHHRQARKLKTDAADVTDSEGEPESEPEVELEGEMDIKGSQAENEVEGETEVEAAGEGAGDGQPTSKPEFLAPVKEKRRKSLRSGKSSGKSSAKSQPKKRTPDQEGGKTQSH